MVEKANPWWRKTLNYARGEIRTGFGILPGPPKLTRDEEEGFFERLEQILNVEAELTDQSPNPETTPVTPVDAATQDHLHEPVQNPRPFMASAPVQEIAPVYLPATEPTPRPEPEMEAVVESVTAVVSTPVTEPSPAPANEPLALAKKSAPRSPRKPKAAPR